MNKKKGRERKTKKSQREKMENESVTKMTIKCIVRGCSSRKITGNGILFHTIPSDSTKRAKWISMLEDWTGIRFDVRSKGENSAEAISPQTVLSREQQN